MSCNLYVSYLIKKKNYFFHASTRASKMQSRNINKSDYCSKGVINSGEDETMCDPSTVRDRMK